MAVQTVPVQTVPVQGIPRVTPADAARPDEESFEGLVTRHWPSIKRIARKLAGNGADADDLTQEAVLEAYRAFSRFQPGTRFDRWIARIMTHTFIDSVRHRRRHSAASLDEPDAPTPIDPAPGPDELAARSELRLSLQSALATLPAEFRRAVVLVDLEGYGYQDAARVMGSPIGTVRSRLHRARMMLRRSLDLWVEQPRRVDVPALPDPAAQSAKEEAVGENEQNDRGENSVLHVTFDEREVQDRGQYPDIGRQKEHSDAEVDQITRPQRSRRHLPRVRHKELEEVRPISDCWWSWKPWVADPSPGRG